MTRNTIYYKRNMIIGIHKHMDKCIKTRALPHHRTSYCSDRIQQIKTCRNRNKVVVFYDVTYLRRLKHATMMKLRMQIV
jgi:hypothetical protein